MNGLVLITLELAGLAWIIQRLMVFARYSTLLRKSTRSNVPDLETVKDYVEKYGTNSNSFLTLYPGFKYFASVDTGLTGVIAYAETDNAFVAASEPLAPKENQVRLLDEFARFAGQFGKRTLLLPADLDFAERSEKEGFGSLCIGSEPTFVLNNYPPEGSDWQTMIPSVKQLVSKGAKVLEFKPEQLDGQKKARLEEMVDAWFGTRKTATLQFLNQVNPWLHS